MITIRPRKFEYRLLRKRWIAVCGVGLAMLCGSPLANARAVEAPPTQRITVPQAFESIRVDGLSNDVVWERGAITYGYLRAEDGEPAKYATRARALYDRRNLYFAFTAVEPAMDNIRSGVNRSGDSMEGRNTVGLRLILPTGDESSREIELHIDPNNQVWVFENGSLVEGGMEGLKSAVYFRPGSWDTEVLLPFSKLGVDEPSVGDVWEVDFLRTRVGPDGEGEISAWNPPNGRGDLRFGRDLLVYLYSQHPFSDRDEVMVYNYSESLRQLRAELIDAETGKVFAHETIYIGSGHRRQHFPLPSPESGDYYLIVRQTDRPLESDDDKLIEWRPQRSDRR